MVATDIKITNEDIEWVKKYIKNPAPSGNEVRGQKNVA
jgi:hypothetical protein